MTPSSKKNSSIGLQIDNYYSKHAERDGLVTVTTITDYHGDHNTVVSPTADPQIQQK